MGDLKGKVAVVTGASKGIGAAIAKGLSAAGAAVVVNYSSSTEGANGRNDSRRLIFAFSNSFMSARRGSHRMERLPSARGPHSIRP